MSSTIGEMDARAVDGGDSRLRNDSASKVRRQGATLDEERVPGVRAAGIAPCADLVAERLPAEHQPVVQPLLNGIRQQVLRSRCKEIRRCAIEIGALEQRHAIPNRQVDVPARSRTQAPMSWG